MNKNIVPAVVLAIVVLAEGAYIVKLRHGGIREEVAEGRPVVMMNASPAPNSQRPPMPPVKGDTLANSTIAKSAFEVYPGALTTDVKTALIGWDIKAVKNKDGSATISMIPKNPDDPTNSYMVKPGNKLYFVEMTSADDHADTDSDSNLRDDYGILVDGNGVVQ